MHAFSFIVMKLSVEQLLIYSVKVLGDKHI